MLEPPVRHNMVEHLEKGERHYLNKKRRLIETVIGQLTGRFKISTVWARKIWILSGRFSRKILAHELSILANTLLKKTIVTGTCDLYLKSRMPLSY